MIIRLVSRSKYSSAGTPLTTMVPLPGLIQQRAMAVLRLPVAYVEVWVAMIVSYACLRAAVVPRCLGKGFGCWATWGWSAVA